MLRSAFARAIPVAALFAVATTIALPRAEANGRFPAAQHVWIGPGRSSRTIALRTTFGFAISHDGGQSFHWVCEQALGYAGGVFDPSFVVDAQSRLTVGLFDGLGTLGSDGCSFARDPAFESQFVADVDTDADGRAVLALTSNGNPDTVNRVLRSVDGGAFEPLGAGMAGVLFATLEMARSNPQRVYLTSIIPTSPSRPAFYRSDDGGATLEEVVFAPASELRAIYVAGIDPTNPDVVFVRGLLRDLGDAGTERVEPTVLLRSEDRGTTWREVARTRYGMRGFAISDDGRTVWYGAAKNTEGLNRSTDGGFTFERIGSQEVQCLRQHEGALYLCANYVTDGYALGRSTDRGDTFVPLLRFEDLQGPFACEGDASSNVCVAPWAGVHAMFVPTIDAGVTPDSGTTAPPPSNCGCTVPARRVGGTWWALVIAGLALLDRRKR